MILFRPQRGSLAASMAEVKSFETLQELADHLSQVYEWPVHPDQLAFTRPIYDHRTKWDTWTVSWCGRAVGFSDGELRA